MWFNPLVWKYRRAVEKNLEFETDQAILDQKKYTPPTYQNNLLLVAVAQKPLVLTTNYNQSLLKERIMKMNAKKSHSYNYWKYLFILPVLIFSALLLNQPALKGKQSFLTDQAPSTLLQTECQALLQAVRSSNIEKVRSLLDSSSDPNCSYRFDGEPRSPLVAAARNGDLEIGKLLLESGADVEFQSRGDEPPLMSAARNGHLEFVQMLIAAGAEVDRIKKGDGTALINAVKSQQLEIAKLLLEHGADPYLEVPGDEYAMYHARISNNATMISLLKSYEKGL